MRMMLAAATAATIVTMLFAPMFVTESARQEATPAAVFGCEANASAPSRGTPSNASSDAAPLAAASPAAPSPLEFTHLYVNMMLTHHASMLALAHAVDGVSIDERIKRVAQAIIARQEPELARLREYQQRLTGSPEALPMDDFLIAETAAVIPAAGDPEVFMQLDPVAMVEAFCAADNRALAFIDLTIAHHETAIAAAETALAQAPNNRLIQIFATRVVRAQTPEVAELTAIRQAMEYVHGLALVTITGGDAVTIGERGEWRVPKRDLAAVVQVLLQGERLRVAEGLAHARTLTEELVNFRLKISRSGGSTQR